MGKRIVIALGGNALGNNLPEQMVAVKHTAKAIVDLIQEGHQVVVAHGNGPPAGMINIAMTTLSREDHSHPIAPMSVCTAMSQGYIGYDLQNSLREELLNRGIQKPVATVLTQVEVDPADPAFQNPSKPIGTFMTEEEAEEMRRRGNCVMEDAGRGWRRCVASPKPKAIVEIETIRTLMEAGQVVIGCGGGGIPVYRTEGNHLKGAGAVIDKDFASELLAESLDADALIILTAVEKAAINFGSEVAGSPDAGGGPAVRGGRPVRPRLHAAQGPGCREVRRVQARPHSPHHPAGEGQGRHRRKNRHRRLHVRSKKGQSVNFLQGERKKRSPCLSFSSYYCAHCQRLTYLGRYFFGLSA